MNDVDKILAEIIKDKGGDKTFYRNLMDAIAYHESAGTMSPTLKQFGGGPGRGKYQFEEGIAEGAITAARRAKQYLESKGLRVPNWLSDIYQNESLDASTLTSEQQDVLFLGNMRMHPRADFSKVVNGEEDIQDFWANYHWAGDEDDRDERIESFNKSFNRYKNNRSSIQSKNNQLPLPEQARDNTIVKPVKLNQNLLNISADSNMNDLVSYVKNSKQQMANGGLLNEFNNGGLHETNPHGGIPQGSNATVEQGETSANLPVGKFIFSDRVSLADGGLIDPPDKNKQIVSDSKDFVKNWFNDPFTKARYSLNKGRGFGETLPDIVSGLNQLDKTNVEYNVPTSDKSRNAGYKGNTISFYKDPTEETATHEWTHVMGIDDDLTNYIRKNYGTPAKAIQDRTGLPFKEALSQELNINPEGFTGKSAINQEILHSRYLSENGELYPRIMEMRKVLGVKPGDIIDDSHIKTLKEKTKNPLFKYYTDEQIKSMLNTLASTQNTNNYNNLV